jgi:PhnB protein
MFMPTSSTLGSTTSMSPYMTVSNATGAIDFYVAAFGAEEVFRLVDPADGRIGHAEIVIGGVTIMLSDEYPDFGALSPETIGGSPVKFQVYVSDVDAAFSSALALGASELRPVKDQFFGDRSGMLIDPFGHSWTIASKGNEVSPEEMQKRWNDSMVG